MPVELEREKLFTSGEMGVFDETAKLKRAIMWGEPGPEAIIAQILPEDISCFYQNFSVLKAREEFNSALAIIQNGGTEVILVKDLYANMINDQKIEPRMSLEELKLNLVKKAVEFSKQYPNGYTGELEKIDDIIDEDAEKYDERAVIVMNDELSLTPSLPMANVLYARDQSNVAGNTWIWSSMRHGIRQPEVALYKKILTYAGIARNTSFKHIAQVNGDGRFEGGDGIPYGGFYFVGIGGRTNWEGVKQIAPSVLVSGLRLVIFRDKVRDKGRESEMKAMHLDTIWMPSDVNEAVACTVEMQRRLAFEVVTNPNGEISVSYLGGMDHFMKNQGIEIIPLSEQEQMAFAPNFLNLGNRRIILSLVDKTHGERTIDVKLSEKGKNVQNAGLWNITRGYGGLHCMTAAIQRE